MKLKEIQLKKNKHKKRSKSTLFNPAKLATRVMKPE